jgi:hypothetical protein
MYGRILVTGAVVLLACAAGWAQTPAGTAFTYQGQLKVNGAPVDSSADLLFKLFDAASGGTQLGADVQVDSVAVSQGLFTVLLDFDANPFDGNARYLEIWVRSPAGGGVFAQLSPRQELTPTPYALYSTAPWVTGPAGLSYSGGNVAIGTDEPGPLLSVTNTGSGIAVAGTSSGGAGILGYGAVVGVWGTSSGGIGAQRIR